MFETEETRIKGGTPINEWKDVMGNQIPDPTSIDHALYLNIPSEIKQATIEVLDA